MKIVSGGQTGVDRAALDVALELGIDCGGWCPAGRWAEDGPIDSRYPLVETPSAEPAERTEWNVRDSDGTLLLTGGRSAGTELARDVARRLGRPVFTWPADAIEDVGLFRRWLQVNASAPSSSRVRARANRPASTTRRGASSWPTLAGGTTSRRFRACRFGLR